MQKTNTVLAVIATLLGCSSTLLYQQNSTLDEKIRKNAEQCEQQIAILDEQYQGEIDDLRGYLLKQYSHGTGTKSVVKAEKAGFNQLISAGHRMRAINRKYEFLLGSVLLDDEGKDRLRRLLYQWERLADSARAEKAKSGAAPRRLQAELDNTDVQIKALLTDPTDYEHFITQRQRDL